MRLKISWKTVTYMAAIFRQSVVGASIPTHHMELATFWIQKQMLLNTSQTTNHFLILLKKQKSIQHGSPCKQLFHIHSCSCHRLTKKKNKPRKRRNEEILHNLSEANGGQTCKSHSLILTFTYVGMAATQCIRKKDYLRPNMGSMLEVTH